MTNSSSLYPVICADEKARDFYCPILDKRRFFKVISDYSTKSTSTELAGLWPSSGTPLPITILRFQFSKAFDFTYILVFRGFAWIDDFDLPFLSKWIFVDALGVKHLSLKSVASYEYKNLLSYRPVWITGTRSRGCHSFHYAHYAVDYLMGVSFVLNMDSNMDAVFIQESQQAWQKSLLSYFDLRPKRLELDRSSLFQFSGMEVSAHSLHAVLFEYSPQLSSEAAQSALVTAYAHRRWPAMLTHSHDKVSAGVLSRENILFFSRSRYYHKRLTNESIIFDIVKKSFPRARLICPEDYAPRDLIAMINELRPIIVSASSGALDPLMLLCEWHPIVIMFMPFTREEIVALNKAAIYADIPRSRKCLDRVAFLGIKSSIEGANWNTPLCPCPKLMDTFFRQLACRDSWGKSNVEDLYDNLLNKSN